MTHPPVFEWPYSLNIAKTIPVFYFGIVYMNCYGKQGGFEDA
jgi:hypothetical protein